MQGLHAFSQLAVKFDEPNLVSCAGLTPVMSLAESCQLPELVAAMVTVPGPAGANAAMKVPALVAGHWWPGWSRGRTASRTWTCSGMAG